MGLGGCLGGLYPVPTQPSQDPYLVYSEAKGPTYGQMKAIIGPGYEVSQTGSTN